MTCIAYNQHEILADRFLMVRSGGINMSRQGKKLYVSQNKTLAFCKCFQEHKPENSEKVFGILAKIVSICFDKAKPRDDAVKEQAKLLKELAAVYEEDSVNERIIFACHGHVFTVMDAQHASKISMYEGSVVIDNPLDVPVAYGSGMIEFIMDACLNKYTNAEIFERVGSYNYSVTQTYDAVNIFKDLVEPIDYSNIGA